MNPEKRGRSQNTNGTAPVREEREGREATQGTAYKTKRTTLQDGKRNRGRRRELTAGEAAKTNRESDQCHKIENEASKRDEARAKGE